MPLLREQPKQPKSALIQVRVEEEIKTNLDHYARFIKSSEAWVVSEALRFLFRKDNEFQRWKSNHNGDTNYASHDPVEAEVPIKANATR